MSNPIGVDRRVLSVIGPHSSSGKTLFVRHLLRSIAGLGCLKISPAVGKLEDPELEEGLRGRDFYLEEAGRLRREGKDTTLYLEAGARQVERLRHRGAGLAAGLEAAFERFPADVPIVVESSSAVELLDPVAVVLIVRPPLREMKPATERVLPRVTDLLVNGPRHDDDTLAAPEKLRREFETLRPPHTWSANLGVESPPDEMLARLSQVLSIPHPT
jgi:hypothetical protein